MRISKTERIKRDIDSLQKEFKDSAFLRLDEKNNAGEMLCVKFWGLDPKTAKARAARDDLPIPVFRPTDSQKAPYMIHVRDLAEHLDRMKEKAA